MNTAFDASLKQISHYRAYPAMLPFVGEEYVSEQHKKVLVIGESHYLPEASTVHHDAEAWYAGSQESLNDKEVGWINTREVIMWLHEDKKRFFGKINQEIEAAGFGESKPGIQHIAFMNAFQRPSREKESIKGYETEKDISLSADVIRRVVDILKPDTVIFASKGACEKFHTAIGEQAKTEWVYHPTGGYGSWWLKPEGKEKFASLLTALKNQ